MTILKVAQLGHPILRTPAAPVASEDIQTPAVQQLIRDMFDTMEEYEGAGLAAPQVHVSARIVVLTLDDDQGPEVWINPEITPLTEHTSALYEGCLSVTGLRGRVERPNLIHVRCLDHHGQARAYILQGFPAIVAQHECDHLDGVLYVDRADPVSLAFVDEFRKHGPLHAAAEDDEEDEEDVDDAAILVDPTLSPEAAMAVATRA